MASEKVKLLCRIPLNLGKPDYGFDVYKKT